MVTRNLQSELFLELVLRASEERDVHMILKKCIPLYLKKLNCFFACVLKKNTNGFEEVSAIPVVVARSNKWSDIRRYFEAECLKKPISKDTHIMSYKEDKFTYYAYLLNSYGLLILGRKNEFNNIFKHELVAVVNHLGKTLIQADDSEKRKKAELQLLESEHRFRQITENSREWIWEVNSDGLITYSSPIVYEMLGYNSHDLIGKKYYYDLFCPEEYHEQREELIKQLENGHSFHDIILKCCTRLGEVVWMSGSGIEILNENGEIVGYRGANINITKRKIAELALIKAKEKAEESDRLKSSFLANMSHEIRTPMNGILGFADLLKEQHLTGEEQKTYLDIIAERGERLLNVINDLIDISKVESGQMELITTVSNINDRLDSIYKFFLPEVESKGMNLKVSKGLATEEATLCTDFEKLHAILLNLVKNAIKYSDQGTIEMGYKMKKNNLKFYVSDNGIGIRENQQTAIFDRFIQADNRRSKAIQGSGLGLSITKAYVKMLGGEIWLKSCTEHSVEYNKSRKTGTTFYFTIPYRQKPDA